MTSPRARRPAAAPPAPPAPPTATPTAMPRRMEDVWLALAGLQVVAWIVVGVLGDIELGGHLVTPQVAAAAAGTALAACRPPRTTVSGWTVDLAAMLAPLVVAVMAWRLVPESDLAALVLLAVAAALVVVPWSPAMPLALLCGLRAAAYLGSPAVVVVLAAVAIALAALRDRPRALAVLAISAGGLAPAAPAGALLAAAAVCAAAIATPVVGLAAVPGLAALVLAVAEPVSVAARVSLSVAAIAVAVAIALALRQTGHRLRRWEAPALVVGIWLVLAPGTWGWTGDAGIGTYDAGMARALAVAALTGVGRVLWIYVRTERAPANGGGTVVRTSATRSAARPSPPSIVAGRRSVGRAR